MPLRSRIFDRFLCVIAQVGPVRSICTSDGSPSVIISSNFLPEFLIVEMVGRVAYRRPHAGAAMARDAGDPGFRNLIVGLIEIL
jgi:hypothetical protein